MSRKVVEAEAECAALRAKLETERLMHRQAADAACASSDERDALWRALKRIATRIPPPESNREAYQRWLIAYRALRALARDGGEGPREHYACPNGCSHGRSPDRVCGARGSRLLRGFASDCLCTRDGGDQ